MPFYVIQGALTEDINKSIANEENAKKLVLKKWHEKKAWGLERSEKLPVYAFQRDSRPTNGMVIPCGSILDPNQNYIIACYMGIKPFDVTILGVCQGRRLKTCVRAKDLTYDVEEPEILYETSMTSMSTGDTQMILLEPTNSQPTILDGTQSASLMDSQQPIIIPDFFCYKGKPVSLPDFVLSNQLAMDASNVWDWLKSAPLEKEVIHPPETEYSIDAVFFVMVVASIDDPANFIWVYSRYLEQQIKHAMPTRSHRREYARINGLSAYAQKDIEQHFMKVVNNEIEILKETEMEWFGRVPKRFEQLLELLGEKLSGTKRRKLQ